MKQILRLALALIVGMLAFLLIAVLPTMPAPAERGGSSAPWPLFSVYLYARENPSTLNVARAMRGLLIQTSLSAAVAFTAWMLLYRRSKIKRALP